MRNRIDAGDLESVITLLDDIAYARDTSFMQSRLSHAALGRLIQDEPKIKEFALIADFIEKQRLLPLDVGTRLRQRAEEMADWCRDLEEDA